MSLENKELILEIFEGRIDIALIVSNNHGYFIFDEKENYTIDIEPYYKKYLADGIVDENQYTYAMKQYRSGASKLENSTFPLYISSLKIKERSFDEMRNFFLDEYNNICSETINHRKIVNLLKMTLPTFYINLDDKFICHSYFNMGFENNLPLGWIGKCVDNILLYIPEKYKYWKGVNFNIEGVF